MIESVLMVALVLFASSAMYFFFSLIVEYRKSYHHKFLKVSPGTHFYHCYISNAYKPELYAVVLDDDASILVYRYVPNRGWYLGYPLGIREWRPKRITQLRNEEQAAAYEFLLTI